MYKIIVILIICVIIVNKFTQKRINNYIDKIFEIEFNKKRNKFVRLFISKEKKCELNNRYTLNYRKKISKIINIITIIIITILMAVFLFYCIFGSFWG